MNCSRCGAPILWAVTDSGKRMPLDNSPAFVAGEVFAPIDQHRKRGLFYVDRDLTGELRCHALTITTPFECYEGAALFQSHFSSCAFADEFRQERGSARVAAVLVGVLVAFCAAATPAAADVPYVANWQRVRACETRGTPEPLAWRLDTGNGYFGGLQFDTTTWSRVARHGSFSRRYRTADQAPWWVQIGVANRLLRIEGLRRGLRHWRGCGWRWFA